MHDCIIIGSGPAGMGCAFALREKNPKLKILIIDKENYSSGGLRNDCKMNFSFPIGFPAEYWKKEEADYYLDKITSLLPVNLMEKKRISTYQKRAEKLDVELVSVLQSHLGTDGGLKLIKELQEKLKEQNIDLALKETVQEVDLAAKTITTDKRELSFDQLIIAPGRKGFDFLRQIMKKENIEYIDNIVDIGIRMESRIENYSIVKDYYDPKFHFPGKVRSFCTNSGAAYVVKEKYQSPESKTFFSANGHSWSKERKENGLVNWAMLRTVRLTEPLASGQEYASMLGVQAALLAQNNIIMQRVGDFRMGKRSKRANFNDDLYNFQPSLKDACPGDVSLACPAKILRDIWKSLKSLDTIVPGVLHPATIMYYPEIKLYANKPVFMDKYFQVKKDLYLIGDGAGTSRGITAAWASGMRAAQGILKK